MENRRARTENEIEFRAKQKLVASYGEIESREREISRLDSFLDRAVGNLASGRKWDEE